MELTTMDRALLLQALPQEGTFATLRMLRPLREKLALKDEEAQEMEVVEADGVTRWNPTKDHPWSIEITPSESAECLKALKKLNASEKLTAAHLRLCEMFGLE